MAEPINQVSTETTASKIWRRLGFRWPYVPPPEDQPMFAPGSLLSETVVVLDWLDRLRVLVSGKIVVAVRTQTDEQVNLSVATGAFGVLPPTWKVKPPGSAT